MARPLTGWAEGPTTKKTWESMELGSSIDTEGGRAPHGRRVDGVHPRVPFDLSDEYGGKILTLLGWEILLEVETLDLQESQNSIGSHDCRGGLREDLWEGFTR